jgi:hypothetical protein
MSIEEEHVVTVTSGAATRAAIVLVLDERRDDGDGEREGTMSIEEEHVVTVTSGDAIVTVSSGEAIVIVSSGKAIVTISVEEDKGAVVLVFDEGRDGGGRERGGTISVEEDKGAVVLKFDDGRGEVMLTDRIHLLSQAVEEKRDGSNEGERGESKGGATEAAMGSRDPGRASSC